MTIEPPSLNEDGTVTMTSRMGRIDSPAGRKMAAIEAAAAAKQQAADEARRAKEKAAEEKVAAAAAAKAAEEAAAAPPSPAVEAFAPAAPADDGGVLSGVRKKIGNLFGG